MSLTAATRLGPSEILSALYHVSFRLTGVTSNVSFPPRNETNDFNTQLENLYRDRLGASPTSAYVDLEGANVWLTEYARYRVGLIPAKCCSRSSSIRSTCRRSRPPAG